jgi:hypothetical protein
LGLHYLTLNSTSELLKFFETPKYAETSQNEIKLQIQLKENDLHFQIIIYRKTEK